MLDYMLVVAIGIVANLFGATSVFYQVLYPVLIGVIFIVSMTITLVVFVRNKAKRIDDSKIKRIITNNHALLGKTA